MQLSCKHIVFQIPGGIYRACVHVVLRGVSSFYACKLLYVSMWQKSWETCNGLHDPHTWGCWLLASVGQSGSDNGSSFCVVFRWHHSALVGGFSSDWSCWISGGACEWEKSLWLVVQLSKSVHGKRKRCEESKQMTKGEKALLPVPFSTLNEMYSQLEVAMLQNRQSGERNWCENVNWMTFECKQPSESYFLVPGEEWTC